jgi:hypothetical protein
MRILIKLIPAFIFSVILKVNAQTGQKVSIDLLAGQFIKHIRSESKEKIFVQTDKIFYAAGETIWFKAYCLESLSNRPIHLSKNLYLDLVNENDSSVSQLLLNLQERNTSGQILLPESLKEGYYWIRAYTKNILREDSNRIFVRPVFVVNQKTASRDLIPRTNLKTAAEPVDTGMPKFLFFPEGGSIISGTTATVAFRILSALGKPLDLGGFVTDNRNDTVARFKTAIPGAGKFSFDAYNPRRYVAHILWNNRALSFPLPKINQFGSQLSLVSQTNQTFHVRVSLGDSLYKKNKETNIFGISRDSLCFAASGTDMYDVDIPKSSFPKGIATLYLFDDQNQIVSQRAIYIDSNSTKIDIQTDKPGYKPREKVELNIAVSGFDNRPVKGLLSVSVTDDRLTPENAFNEFQLAGFYAKNQELEDTTGSDLQMLTRQNQYEDWKFNNSMVLPAEANHATIADANPLVMSGSVLNKKNEPLQREMVNLFSKEQNIFTTDTTSETGHFQFILPDIADGTQFNLKLTSLEGKGLEGKVKMDDFKFPEFKTPEDLKKGFSTAELAEIREFKIRESDTTLYTNPKVLKPVTVKTQKNPSPNYDASKRVSNFSTIITSDNLNNGDKKAVVNAIQNVPGFNAGFSTMALGASYGVQPLVVLDGVKLTLSTDVMSFLSDIDPATIDFIEILKGPLTSIYGVEGAGGVILINTTNKRKDIAVINDKGIATVYPKGYAKDPGFVSPDYDKKEEQKSSYPDNRPTLYWNGNVQTDENGKASLHFFTSDDQRVYSITIMGIALNGDILMKKIKIKG